MCNFMGPRVTRIQFIKLKQIEKELGTLPAMKELEKMKSGFAYSNAPWERQKKKPEKFRLCNG